ncbi:hypothetical protein F5146DRAFT_1054264 [Armillaria mellea]|nr:hypothetical protein F5146DRAFT_1054264 [Armillaria mellea]
MPLSSSSARFRFLQIRSASQGGTIHKWRGRDVPVPPSVDGLQEGPVNSGVVELDVEEGVPRAGHLSEGAGPVTMRPLSLGSDDNTLGRDLSPSRAMHRRSSLQIPAEESTFHASSSTVPPGARNDEMAEEIVRLRTQIQQLIVGSSSAWNQDRDTDPPPAYVRDV